MNLRKLHRQTAPILFIPLLLTALTGVAYRIGRSWFGLPKEFGNFMMLLHEGRFWVNRWFQFMFCWLDWGYWVWSSAALL